MGRSSKKPLECVSGSYFALPHVLLDSVAFMEASHRARSLLMELMRQHNGKNNGHFQLTVPYLAKRGWRSVDQIKKAEAELLERQLVIKTRQGGLNIGPSRYALTWLPISNYLGLDISSKDYHPGAYHFLDPFTVSGVTSAGMKKAIPGVRRNAIKRTVVRNSASSLDRSVPQIDTVPSDGTRKSPAIPYDGSKAALSSPATIPPHGNNEYCQLPTAQVHTLKRQPVVGAAGRSGRPKSNAPKVNER